jgi:hypothetical protein
MQYDPLNPQHALRKLHLWRGGRAVECTSLENWQGCKPFVGSNPTLSATNQLGPLRAFFY